MKALEITVDGQRVCTAGVPEFGVVTCVVTGVRRMAAHTEDGRDQSGWTHDLHVGGLHYPEPGVKAHLDWHESDLRVGQQVVARLVEVDEADEPVERQRETQRDEIEQNRQYLDHLRREIERVTAELESTE